MKRSYWHSNHLGVDYDPEEAEERVPVAKADANLISSVVEGYEADPTTWGAMHMPAIDIDHPCHLRETETPGHYHLLIDKPMTWKQYARLLVVMEEVGLVEPGYLKASLERGQTFLALKPWKGGNEQAQ